ncbi:MAG TPA: NAD(P)H-dependent oxidoreductase [Ignavibacteriaceae bacterium]|nr:NAD(P)H-dependent oxidoreductase [Ignavibacteriaceae bacterium]
MKIAILLGSVRNNREGNKVGKFAKKLTEGRGWEVEIVDPVEYELPMLEQVYKQMKTPDEKFVKIHNILNNADGFIMVAAEYNHSIPPALKNLLDHYHQEYYYKPTAIISYSSGPFGGIRAAEQLKLICSELRTIPIPISLPISKSHESLNDDGTSVNGDYERRAEKFLNEFQWYLEALKNQREKRIPNY